MNQKELEKRLLNVKDWRWNCMCIMRKSRCLSWTWTPQDVHCWSGGRKLPHPRLLLPLKDYANTSLVSAGGSCVQQIHNNYCFLFLVSFKKRLLNTTGTLKNLSSFGGFTSCLTGILRRNFAKLEWEIKPNRVMEGGKLE